MQREWVKELFGTEKPIVAMCRFNPLAGDPQYDHSAGVAKIVDWARTDLAALQDGGVDAVMFSNEFSLPYSTNVEPVTTATMARVVGELMSSIRVPFGVNVLWDARATLDLAAATGAGFVREVFTGIYASDFGLWDTNCGEVVRHKHRIGAGNVRLFFNIVPEGGKYLGERKTEDIAKSTVFNTLPDALCVSGLTAGAPTDAQIIQSVKQTVGETPVFANTGVTAENVHEQLGIADGAIVGTTLKYDGVFENHVDERRVAQLMQKVRSVRGA